MVSTFCCSTFVCEMSVFSRAPGRILKAGKERVVHGGASVALALDALAGGGSWAVWRRCSGVHNASPRRPRPTRCSERTRCEGDSSTDRRRVLMTLA
jgi:hypothetical protein